MITWEVVPKNYRHPKRLADYYPAYGFTVSERGVELFMQHVFQAAIGKACGKINVTFEAIEATWVCIDWWFEGNQRSIKTNQMPATVLKLVTLYPPERGTPSPGGRRNDVFDLSIHFKRPRENPYYSDDREVFARRLLQTASKVWVDTWNLMEEIEGGARRKWPVKLWVHGRPNEIYQPRPDGVAERLEGHAPVDERIVMAQEVLPIS